MTCALEPLGLEGQGRDGAGESGARPLERLEAHTLQSRETPESKQGRGWEQVGP